MKLAELLAVRKSMNVKFEALRLNGVTYPATQQVTRRLKASDPITEAFKDPVYKPAMQMIGELHFVSACLATIDMAINKANFETMIKVPASVGLYYTVQHSSELKDMLLHEAVLFRKHADAMILNLTKLTSSMLKEPKFVSRNDVIPRAQRPGTGGTDSSLTEYSDVVIQVNTSELDETTKALDFWSKMRRSLDVAIQQANYNTEVTIPAWALESFRTEMYNNPEAGQPPKA